MSWYTMLQAIKYNFNGKFGVASESHYVEPIDAGAQDLFYNHGAFH